MTDLLYVSFDKDEKKKETGLCVGRVNKDGSDKILKMELDSQADTLYKILTNQSVKAIPLDRVEQIRAEMQELIDWHDCPIEYDNGNDAWYCEAVNQCISKLDKAIKEQIT